MKDKFIEIADNILRYLALILGTLTLLSLLYESIH